MTRKFLVRVTQWVEVELDETKFDEVFMAEFQESFFPYDRLEDHAEHLGQLYARGIAGASSDEFIEGYGPVKEMGIRFAERGQEEEVE